MQHEGKMCDFDVVTKRRVGCKIATKQMSEHQNEMSQSKGNMETITIFVSEIFKEGESDAVGVTNSCRAINDAMSDWCETRMAQNIVNEKS